MDELGENGWQAPFEERAAAVADQLRVIQDTLDEIVVDHLRSAVQHGVTGRPPLDKRLQAARRAVEKAVRTLDRT